MTVSAFVPPPVPGQSSRHNPLGMFTGRCVLYDYNDLPVAMKVYHDGSGNGKDAHGDEWITLGAVAATDTVWQDFENKWNFMLGPNSRYPPAPYIHMIKLMGHDSPFDRPNGWDLVKKRQLISDAIVVLSQMNKDEFRWFRLSINDSAVQRLQSQGVSVPIDRHKHLSLMMATMTIGPYLQNCSTPEKISLFFDRGEKFMKGINVEWLARRTPPGETRKPENFWWDAIENIISAEQAFTPPIQVADMVAWAHTRTLPAAVEREFSDLKSNLIKFVPSTNLDITEDVFRHVAELRKSVR
jgi:Protein of unknown function (DUF3800)